MADPCIGELLRRYCDAAVRAGDISDPNPKKQHKAADEVHECYKLLRQTEEGRQGIINLMSDPNPYVRLSAAADSLQWVPESARSVLESLRDEHVFPYSLTARITLSEFDKGRLKFDY